MPDAGSGSGVSMPPVGGHYSRVVRRGNLLFTAGQVGWDDERVFPQGIAAQTRGTLENIRRVLASEGATLGDIVSVTAYLSDLADFATYNDAYREFFPENPPARTSVGATLAPGCLVEIAAVAVLE